MNVKKIYFDMDGVLANFDKGVEELAGFSIVKQDVAEKNGRRGDVSHDI